MAKKDADVLDPAPRGYLRDWNFKLEQMPETGDFEVMRIHREVYRFEADSLMVVDPITGKMFRPVAWRRKEPR